MRIACIVLGMCTLLSAQQRISEVPNLSSPIRMAESASKGHLVKRIDPQYPTAAQTKCIQGDVVLLVITATDGSVKSATAISGPVELQAAAIQAVKEWKYVPYFLNGTAMEVETRATLKFRLPLQQCDPKTLPPKKEHGIAPVLKFRCTPKSAFAQNNQKNGTLTFTELLEAFPAESVAVTVIV